MDAGVVWTHGMTFIGSAETGFQLRLDADPSVGGDNSGFRPMELLLIGLAGCTGMDVVSILRKKQVNFSGLEVKVHAEKATTHPKVFTSAEIEYIVSGQDIDLAAVERSVELSITRYCPANAMLGQCIPITTRITILQQA